MSFKKYILTETKAPGEDERRKEIGHYLPQAAMVEIIPIVWNSHVDFKKDPHNKNVSDLKPLADKINQDEAFNAAIQTHRKKLSTPEMQSAEAEQRLAADEFTSEKKAKKIEDNKIVAKKPVEKIIRTQIDKTFIENLTREGKDSLVSVLGHKKLLNYDEVSKELSISTGASVENLLRDDFIKTTRAEGRTPSGPDFMTKVRLADTDKEHKFIVTGPQLELFSPKSMSNAISLFKQAIDTMSETQGEGDENAMKEELISILSNVAKNTLKEPQIGNDTRIKWLKGEYAFFTSLFAFYNKLAKAKLSVNRERDREKVEKAIEANAYPELTQQYKNQETYSFASLESNWESHVMLELITLNSGKSGSQEKFDLLKASIKKFFETSPEIKAGLIEGALSGKSKFKDPLAHATHILYVRGESFSGSGSGKDFGKTRVYPINAEFINKIINLDYVSLEVNFSQNNKSFAQWIRTRFNPENFSRKEGFFATESYAPKMSAKELVHHSQMLELWIKQLNGESILEEGVMDVFSKWWKEVMQPIIKSLFDYLIDLIKQGIDKFMEVFTNIFDMHVGIHHSVINMENL